MPIVPLNDETIWGLPDAMVARSFPGAEAFSTTPLLNLLRAGAAYDPEAIALVGQAASFCYADLLRLAQNVACAVADLVPAGQPVACLLPRSPEGIAGLLGCLISGRLCMVLDPAHPAERQAGLLEDSAPVALMLAEPLPFTTAAPVLMLREALAGPAHDEYLARDWRPDHDWDPDAPFAVYFTSGSSGRPKGIVLSARSVLYRALENVENFELTQEDRVLAPAVPVAGGGLSMLLAVLARGARMLLSDVAMEGAGAVLRLIEREMVTRIAIEPPIMRLLSQLERARFAFRALRTLRIGAAALFRTDLAAWRPLLPPGCSVWHAYSSTEALLVANWVVPVEDTGTEATVAAGMLHPSQEYALLGEDDSPVLPSEPGELVLRSRYVALGEWQGGRLVSGRMPPVPGRPGWRFFRTGDVLRVQPDGMLRVLGRADRQVKINAIRVEPAEIEAILRAEPGVADAAVVASTVSGRIRLHGFVASTEADQPALIAALRRRLSAALPMASRPPSLTVLDRLPTLPSGKIDLIALSGRMQP